MHLNFVVQYSWLIFKNDLGLLPLNFLDRDCNVFSAFPTIFGSEIFTIFDDLKSYNTSTYTT